MIAAVYPDPWRFVPNPEVYVLVAFLVGAFVYSVRVIGPRAVPPGQPVVTRREVLCFVAAMAVLFVASTWPIHQIGEDYLYSVHMFQHQVLSFVLPPLALLATPAWLVRLIIGQGKGYRVARFLTRPVVAAIPYNVMVMVLHIPGVVNASTTNGPLHFALHLGVVATALLLWMPVVGPLTELQMSYGAKMVYLFLTSVISTVPAMWLALADGVVYSHYGRQPVRVWGLSAIDDQQIAGVFMKTGGGLFVWVIVIVMFFRRFSKEGGQETYRRGAQMPSAEITGHDEVDLTYEAVAGEFERSPAPTDPSSPHR